MYGRNTGYAEEREPQERLLHGVLRATIDRIDKLHNGLGAMFRGASSQPPTLGQALVYPAKRLFFCQPKILRYKLYATIDLGKARVARTRTVNNPTRPEWSDHFTIYCAHKTSRIIFTVKDDNPVGATLIGRAKLPVDDILQGRSVDRWVDILDVRGKPIRSKIHVLLQFTNVSQDQSWSQGIKSPNYPGVPRTFFKQRSGCKVTLYQDAHVLDEDEDTSVFTNMELAGGVKYQAGKCWRDIYDSINNAKHLIYIAGWSIYHAIKLVRDPANPEAGTTLGELLKRKANVDKVRVLLLVWDDRTSVGPLKKEGIMATHDQETLDFFRGSEVRCFLCPRISGSGLSLIQDFETATVFTHHQKTVVVDAEVVGLPSLETDDHSGGKRRIVSYLGGIDLCNGRYDRPDHSLFRTLKNVHKYDFHQSNFPGASIEKGGPREPWHDIHCKLEGPVAWDVLYNFEQRWKKQAGKNNFLFTMNELYGFIIPPSQVISPDDPESWNVQIFRSIDNGAALGFPDRPEADLSKIGLVSGKGRIIDRSIQDGYIHAIRRAKDFIYIENQYFLGSSYGWKPNEGINVDDINALHLIPKELSLKIVSKIKANERFSVYAVIPMWPEGEPESASVQAILDWQRRTIEMMYTDISSAIQETGSNAHPKDYLSFFCLANRELLKPEDEIHPISKPEPGSNYFRAQQARRFMIYVHAKMMIVDDEYIIIGSANINQRSMDGGRDTEIAMGAFQPHNLSTVSESTSSHEKATHHHAHGQVYGFRMALWYEHLKKIHPTFRKPEKLDCMHEVNKMAEENWKIYKADFFDQDLPGHLLPYPIEVNIFGKVTAADDCRVFLDTKASVLGTKSDKLPPFLTT